MCGDQLWYDSFPFEIIQVCSLLPSCKGFPGGSDGKESTCNAGDLCSISGLGRSPGEGHGSPVQYSFLENFMGRGAWWATIQSMGLQRVRHEWVTEHIHTHPLMWGFPSGAGGKEPTCQCRRCKRLVFDPWVGKIPRRRQWYPTPVFFPGKFHGQRSLMGYSPWGCRVEHRWVNEHPS